MVGVVATLDERAAIERAIEEYQGPHARQHAGAGMHSLRVVCDLCPHEAVLSVDAWPGDVPVSWFGPRMVCTACGIIGAFARPNWQERPTGESLTGRQWSV